MKRRTERTRTGYTFAARWPLVDPELGDPRRAAMFADILELARREPTPDGGCESLRPAPAIDLDLPGVPHLLHVHRLWTLIPLEAVGAQHRQRLRRIQRDIAAAQLRLRAAAGDLLSVLDAAGFETRVLKGLATAELDYPDPSWRHTGDVDLAVRLDELDDVRRLLATRGYTDHPNPFPEPLLYGWTLDGPHGIELDLHTRLFRRSPLDDTLFADPGAPMVTLPGVALRAEHRLVHAAGHFIISPPGTRRLSGLIDVTRLLDRPDLDLDESRRFAAALGVESLVGAGIGLEASLSDRPDVLAQLAGWKPPDWVERSTRLVPERRLVLDHLARFREVPPGHRLRYLPHWLLPDRRQRALFVTSAGSAARRFLARR